jgi:hypothetical protein
MIIVGLLSTKEQVVEIKFIAQVCSVEIMVKTLVRNQKMKELFKKESIFFENRKCK